MEQLIDRAGVIIPWTDPIDRPSEERLKETEGLIKALGFEAAFVRAEQLRSPSASHLLSGGLLDRFDDNLRESGASLAVIDAALTPVQQRNLETRLGQKVVDRTGLILEIFGLRARTREGVLQVEHARLLYERSRLVRTWTHLERQRGGSGFLGGPGETQLESDRRMLDRQLASFRRQLEDVRRTRGVQRAGRRRQSKPLVALVGYTNAGKSTLFNRLSGADVLAKDMPFATLDSTIRKFSLPTLGDGSLVDTVGFITDLPTGLIDSFRATLEETLAADLILHVRDRASPDDAQQKREVLKVLQQLTNAAGEPLPPVIEAWNKADCLSPRQRAVLAGTPETDPNGDDRAVLVSALTGEGVDQLLAVIEAELLSGTARLSVTLGPDDGAARAWIHAHAQVEDETFKDNGNVDLRVRLAQPEIGRLKTLFGIEID
ncbi:MAG: GTPase HflX [Pseudomonadota bacterium]